MPRDLCLFTSPYGFTRPIHADRTMTLPQIAVRCGYAVILSHFGLLSSEISWCNCARAAADHPTAVSCVSAPVSVSRCTTSTDAALDWSPWLTVLPMALVAAGKLLQRRRQGESQ